MPLGVGEDSDTVPSRDPLLYSMCERVERVERVVRVRGCLSVYGVNTRASDGLAGREWAPAATL